MDLIKLHQKALRQFSDIWNAVEPERAINLIDRRFVNVPGAMWEGKFSEQFENKPTLEINKVSMAVQNTVNEQRNNRISVDFIPKDGGEDKTADICDSLLRSDEARCNARGAYDAAFEEAVSGGIGAWKLTTEYEDAEDVDNDYQRIAFLAIPDADQSVFFDLDSVRADKLDSKHCFLVSRMTKPAYTEKYNDQPSSWPKPEGFTNSFDWNVNDTVYIAEYFLKEQVSENCHYYKDLGDDIVKFTDAELTDDKKTELAAIGTTFSHLRKIKRTKVRKYVMSGGGVLEDTGYIAGPNIPVVLNYGKRVIVDGIERCSGRVRLAKDPARVINIQFSQLVSQASENPQEIPIFISEQMADPVIQRSWAESSVNNPKYLTVEALRDDAGNIIPAGPIGYSKPSQLSPALVGLMQKSDADLKEILGTMDRGDELKANVSGVAVGMVQERVDMKDYIYYDNHANAHKTSGIIWLGMAREVYVEEGRSMKTVSEQGKSGSIKLNSDVMINNAMVSQYDFTKANFDVSTSVSKTFTSKRAATLESVRGLLQTTTDPQDAKILSTSAMSLIEGEGMSDIRDYARKQLVKLGAAKPTEEEKVEAAKELEAQAPDANEEFLRAAAEEKKINGIKDLAATEKLAAETKEIELDTDIKERESGLNIIGTLEQMQANDMNASQVPQQ